MEFLAIKTLVNASINFSLIQLDKPLLLSSDASYRLSTDTLFYKQKITLTRSAYGGLSQQWTDTPQIWSRKGPTLTDTTNPEMSLVTTGAFSRSFSRPFLVRAIVVRLNHKILKSVIIITHFSTKN